MNFDPVARSYQLLERITFGNALQRCRMAHVDRLKNAENVLILGEGDGRFLEAFLRLAGRASITVVDSSQRMIELARRRTQATDGVTFMCGDIRGLELGEQGFDLIVTHFFLDCFEEESARKIVRQLRQCLTAEGHWLWSDFSIPTRGWSRPTAKVVVWALYRFFRLTAGIEATRLVNIEQMFEENGLSVRAESVFLNGLLRSQLLGTRSL